MDGEQKALACLGMATLVCVSVIYSLLFISLWPYHVWIGLSLLTLLFILAGVFVRGKANEQNLRTVRIRHHEETPLDEHGEPLYYHHGFQPNPHRR